MTPDSRSAKLAAFVEWARAHITGDEKGEAHIFLDRLFQAFGHAGSLDSGGEHEFRVRKAREDGGGTSFADYVRKPVVLIEMKKRGVNLAKHYRQAFDYWTRLVPGRPRYVVLCNFDEFHVYDFETQMDSPVGRVNLADLAENFGALAFLFPDQPVPVFENEHVAVTRAAAAKLARCFNSLVARGVARPLAQRFILQSLIALFAEDIGLLEKYFVTRLLGECDEKSSYDLIGGLFRAMNNRAGNPGGRFKGVPYFNGGIFAEPAEIELTGDEIRLLLEASGEDWSKVQPEIFGTVFEQTLGKDERAASGAHFTHPADIMKIVGPTIVEPWREQIESAKTLTRLQDLLHRLSEFRVLDPACGSGNFLYVAYREMKRLEARIFERMEREFKSQSNETGQMRLSFLSAQNFYGLDVNAFAVELAKVTMMIARKLAIDELHITERALPLDNLDKNFVATDALVVTGPDGKDIRTPWPRVDAIIGNPPFLGAKLLKPQLGPDYVKRVRALYPEIPGMADFCVYWVRRAAEHLPPCTTADPVAGRAGLVGTQNIRNNESRVGGLDTVATTGTIVEAVDNQPWSGEANVHVSIANWVNTRDAALLPDKRRLWFKVEPSKATKALWKKQGKLISKEYELSFREVPAINSALSDKANVGEAVALACNEMPKGVFQGVTPGHDGFVLTPDEKLKLEADGVSGKVIHPYLTGREIVTGDGTPERFIIGFGRRNILEAQNHKKAFEHIQENVLPALQAKADGEHESESSRKAHMERWWMLWRDRLEMFEGFAPLRGRFIACARVTKRPIFVFMTTAIWPSEQVQVFLFDDDYSFGILSSSVHWQWFVANCSKLKSDFRYSIESVYNTFPWPQQPDAKAVAALAAAGREVRRIRAAALPGTTGGLRALYRTLELPGKNPLKDAHAALDAAVLAAYGFSAKDDLLAKLLELNTTVATRIRSGDTVTAPGLPPATPNPASYITTDCIRPE